MSSNRKDYQKIQFEKMVADVSSADSAPPRIRHALLAIAVLVAALIAVWPTGPKGGITWANAVEQIESVRTVIAMTETVGPQGLVLHRARIHFKDPGLSRTEVISIQESELGGETGAESIMIIRRETRRAEQLTLLPKLM